jgi:hypothetical protein
MVLRVEAVKRPGHRLITRLPNSGTRISRLSMVNYQRFQVMKRVSNPTPVIIVSRYSWD